jgi:hypothetical protein
MASVLNYAIIGIAPICAAIAIFVGVRAVRNLRRMTGDHSRLTTFLSGGA